MTVGRVILDCLDDASRANVWVVWGIFFDFQTRVTDNLSAWTVQNKNLSSIFLKTQSKHRQAISSKFPKSLRGAGDLVYDFFCDFRGFSGLSKITTES